MEKEKKEFITTDLHLAAALITYGIELLDVRVNSMSGKSSGVFVLKKEGIDINDLTKKYYDSNLKIDAYTYKNNLKKLKTLAMSIIVQNDLLKRT